MRSTSALSNPARSVRQLSATTGARRARLIGRIQNQPDADVRWHLLLATLGVLLEDDPQVDRLLAALVEAGDAEVAAYARLYPTPSSRPAHGAPR